MRERLADAGGSTSRKRSRKNRPALSSLESFRALASNDRIAAFRPDPEATNWFEIQREAWLRHIFSNSRSRPTTKVMAATLAFYINRERFDAWPGQRELCRVAGLSRVTTRKALEDLQSLGYLDIGSKPLGKPNRQPVSWYTFFIPSDDHPAGQVEHETDLADAESDGEKELQWVKSSISVDHSEHAVDQFVHAVGHNEHDSGLPGYTITSDTNLRTEPPIKHQNSTLKTQPDRIHSDLRSSSSGLRPSADSAGLSLHSDRSTDPFLSSTDSQTDPSPSADILAMFADLARL
jgi:hypothetical protein